LALAEASELRLVTADDRLIRKTTRRPQPISAHGRCARGYCVMALRQIGNRIALPPPVIITESEIDEMAARSGRTLDDTTADMGAG
jgi:adenosylmethionine-8-amino-7-oxononanoate aminotransferase